MGALLLAMFGPTVVFGLFALLAVRFGAESRPHFDERPVVDDRPNWFPIGGAGRVDEAHDDEPEGGEPEPAAAAPAPSASRARRQGAGRPLTSPTSAATSPSGV